MKNILSKKIPETKLKVKLEIPADWNDPGDFTSIKILESGKVVFKLDNLQASALQNVYEFPEGTKSIGKFLKIFPTGAKTEHSQFLLAFSNWVGGSNDDEFILIYLSNNQKPIKIFQQSIDLVSIKDYNKDGLFDLLKSGGRGESVAEDNLSYDPFLVYLQVRGRDSTEFKFNEDLSKKWSAENNYEWHGSKYDEKIRVNKFGKIKQTDNTNSIK